MHTLWLLFVAFLKIGAFTFGGGYAMIPLIAQAITQYQWLNMQEIMDVVAISQMTPGPGHQRSHVYRHKGGGANGRAGGNAGGFAAVHLYHAGSKPVFFQFQENKRVRGVLSMIHPVVLG
ncbi:MAG: chromate transporter [Christensenellales bacterium]